MRTAKVEENKTWSRTKLRWYFGVKVHAEGTVILLLDPRFCFWKQITKKQHYRRTPEGIMETLSKQGDGPR